MQAAGSTASIWRHRNFLTLIGAAFLVSFGGRVYELALPLLIYELSGSSVAMGTMRAVEFLPTANSKFTFIDTLMQVMGRPSPALSCSCRASAWRCAYWRRLRSSRLPAFPVPTWHWS